MRRKGEGKGGERENKKGSKKKGKEKSIDISYRNLR